MYGGKINHWNNPDLNLTPLAAFLRFLPSAAMTTIENETFKYIYAFAREQC